MTQSGHFGFACPSSARLVFRGRDPPLSHSVPEAAGASLLPGRPLWDLPLAYRHQVNPRGLLPTRNAGPILGMANKAREMEVSLLPAEEPEEMPLPSDPKVIFLGGLFTLALLAALYVAAEIVLPLVLAVVLKLLLQPAMRLLERWHVPRMFAALLLILAVFGTIVGLGAAIEGPASSWAAKLPEGIPRLQERLSFLQAPSIRCNGFCSRWRIMDNQQGHPPPARGKARRL